MRYLPLCVCFTLVLESQAHCGEDSHDLCLRKCCPNHQAMYKGACVDHVPTQFTMDVYEEAYLKTGGDLDAFPFVRVKINLGPTDRENLTEKNSSEEQRNKREVERTQNDTNIKDRSGHSKTFSNDNFPNETIEQERLEIVNTNNSHYAEDSYQKIIDDIVFPYNNFVESFISHNNSFINGSEFEYDEYNVGETFDPYNETLSTNNTVKSFTSHNNSFINGSENEYDEYNVGETFDKNTSDLEKVIWFSDELLDGSKNIRATWKDIDDMIAVLIRDKSILNLSDNEQALLLEFLGILVSRGERGDRKRFGKEGDFRGGKERFFLINVNYYKMFPRAIEKVQPVLEKIHKHGLVKINNLENFSHEIEPFRTSTNDLNISNSKSNSNRMDNPMESFSKQPDNKTILSHNHVHNIHIRDGSDMAAAYSESDHIYHNKSFSNGSQIENDKDDIGRTVELKDVIEFFDRFIANENITKTRAEIDLIRTALIINKKLLNLDEEERGIMLVFLNTLASTERISEDKNNRYFIVNLESSRGLIEGLKFRNVLEKVQKHGLVKADVADRNTKVRSQMYGTSVKEPLYKEERLIEPSVEITKIPITEQRHQKEVSHNKSNDGIEKNTNQKIFLGIDVFPSNNYEKGKTEGTIFFDELLSNKTIKVSREDINEITKALTRHKETLNLNNQELSLLLKFFGPYTNKNVQATGRSGADQDYGLRNIKINLYPLYSTVDRLEYQNAMKKIRNFIVIIPHRKPYNDNFDQSPMKSISRETNSEREIKRQFSTETQIFKSDLPNEKTSGSSKVDRQDDNLKGSFSFANQPENKTNARRNHVHNIHNRDKFNITTFSKSDNLAKSSFKSQTKPPKHGIGVPKLFLIYGNPCVGDGFRLDPDKSVNDTYYILDNGRLYYPFVGKAFPISRYCMEYFIKDDHVKPIMCFKEEGQNDVSQELAGTASAEVKLLYVLGMSTSIGFLTITFIVYALVSDLRNLHGCCLMCHIFSLIMAYWFLVMLQVVFPYYQRYILVEICVALGFLIQFFFLSTFFWLNVMCFDIWWTFSSTLRPIHGSISQQESKKFLIYSLYAWTCPSFIVGLTIALDNVTISWLKPLKPGFGEKRCWFTTELANLVFFYGPIGLLVISNICMFISTARTLLQHQKTNNTILTTRGSKRNAMAETERFNLYLKLFAVMGVNWIMELVSWACGGPEYIWYVSDMGNALQGLLIFIIFVCKRRILSLLILKVYPQCRWQYVMQHSRNSQTGGASSGNTARSVASLQLTLTQAAKIDQQSNI